MILTYRDAVDYIEDIPMFTKKHSLEHTKEFLRGLGNPEKNQRVIHVAGTNGKGSVCAYLQAMLRAEGKRVGFFTSPHLVKINERICLNGEPISDELFLEIFQFVKKRVDKMGEEGFAHPSYFEFLFGMGMVAFQKLAPDVTIVETGLGGRLDATNAIEKPELTIITSISLDHTRYLGTTIPEIAMEKAGIIKNGVPVVCDGSNSEALQVIWDQAKRKGTSCRKITNSAFELQAITSKDIAFFRTNAYDGTILWKLSNTGIYQMMNACLAIAGMEELMGEQLSEERYQCWEQALERVVWKGRMEEVMPDVFVDGAHNPGAIQAFCDSVKAIGCPEEEEKKPVILFSAVADKEYDQMIKMLCQEIPAKAYVITEVEDGRRVELDRLRQTFMKYTRQPVYAEKDLCQAWSVCTGLKNPEGRMYCLGSLYLVGMIKDKVLKDKEDI